MVIVQKEVIHEGEVLLRNVQKKLQTGEMQMEIWTVGPLFEHFLLAKIILQVLIR